jgi:hypothetical protein
MGDMEARRDSRNADPEWPDYLSVSDRNYHWQQTQIMRRRTLQSDHVNTSPLA